MRLLSRVASPVLLTLALAALLALQFGHLGGDEAGAEAYPVASGPAPPVALGVTTPALAINAHRRWRPGDLGEVNTFEQQARQHMGIVMWFADWANTEFDPAQARAVARRGSIPEISWEPWDADLGPRSSQPDYQLRDIIDGRYDRYVQRWARAIARYGGPVRLRFAQEMNARSYPWGERTNGNRPGEFIQAWRHVHGMFSGAGATNVTWIWAPVTGTITTDQYPGDHVVDVVGLSGFNGGSVLFHRGWRSFRDAFGGGLDDLGRLFPGKPVEISEVASTEQGGDKAAWIAGMFAEIQRRPSIEAVIWFNLLKESDWRISSTPRAQEAYPLAARRLRAAGR